MRIEPYQPRHLKAFALQESQEDMRSLLDTPGYAESLTIGEAFTAFDGDTALACFGMITMWENRGVAWGIVSHLAGPFMPSITKAVLRFIKLSGCKRIEATVDVSFRPGVRWLELLGFEQEGRMRKYTPQGADHYLYARVM